MAVKPKPRTRVTLREWSHGNWTVRVERESPPSYARQYHVRVSCPDKEGGDTVYWPSIGESSAWWEESDVEDVQPLVAEALVIADTLEELLT